MAEDRDLPEEPQYPPEDTDYLASMLPDIEVDVPPPNDSPDPEGE
jgi:hypothetical protein